jgi:hypothetical protein
MGLEVRLHRLHEDVFQLIVDIRRFFPMVCVKHHQAHLLPLLSGVFAFRVYVVVIASINAISICSMSMIYDRNEGNKNALDSPPHRII